MTHLNTLAALLLNLSLTELSSKLSTRHERTWGRWTLSQWEDDHQRIVTMTHLILSTPSVTHTVHPPHSVTGHRPEIGNIKMF